LRDASGAEVARLEESSNASEPMFAYEDRKVPGGRGKLPAPKGARLKSADVGVGRFGLSPGLSAALGSVVPEGVSLREVM